MKINNEIIDDYCSLETSKLLAEKGFQLSTLKTICSEDGKNILKPTHSIAFKWVVKNLNWHCEPIWDIYNGKLVWFYAIKQIGDFESESFDTSYKDTL